MSLTHRVATSFVAVLITLALSLPAQAILTGFNDSFNYSTGDLSTVSGGVWTTLAGGLDVVASPSGSTSGPNVVDNTTLGSFVTTEMHAIGTLGGFAGVKSRTFRFEAYTGSAFGANDDMMVRVSNNTTAFSAVNPNIIFQMGLSEGFVTAGRGLAGTPFVDSTVNVAPAANNWYEFRAVYTENAGSDSVVIDYRDITGAGSFINLANYTLVNELSTSVANAVMIQSRDFNSGGMSGDGAALSIELPEPGTVSLLGLGLVAAFSRRKRRSRG